MHEQTEQGRHFYNSSNHRGHQPNERTIGQSGYKRLVIEQKPK